MQDANAVKFTHPTVCKSFLLGLCPYDLFHNTVSKVWILSNALLIYESKNDFPMFKERTQILVE